MEEVTLIIEGQTFKAKKQLLCEYSDYFRAMFSGTYVENEKHVISIDVVDADSMKIILHYMEIGLIDLSDYSLTTIGDLAMAANFLQITELSKQIEYVLEIQMSCSNWLNTLLIAENATYSNLEQLSSAFGLLSFEHTKPKHVPSIHKLFWYLSHPYLDARSEVDVFKFGYEWITHSETGADALLMVLACLDIEKLTNAELIEIKNVIAADFENSLAAKIVDCFTEMSQNNTLSISGIMEQKDSICDQFSDRVYTEMVNLVKESRKRVLNLIPAIPLWTMKDSKPEPVAHSMYTFSINDGFKKWLEVAEKSLWGWSVVSWGLTKLVVVCGEFGRGTGSFMRDVKIYDTLKKEWIQHGVQLPCRRHAGLIVVGDSLFIIGGVGGFRVVLDTAVVYNLKERTCRTIANLPDAIQNPAVCTHENQVYAAGHNTIYRYEDSGDSEQWVRVIGTDIRMSCMVSYKGFIYCTQNYFSNLYRFKPDTDKRLAMISTFSHPPAAICNLGDRLMFFTRTMCGQSDTVSIEEFTEDCVDKPPKVVWSRSDSHIKVNDVAGSCSLVMTMPPLHRQLSQYHEKYLSRYYD